MTKRRLLVVALALFVLAAAGVATAYLLYERQRGQDVRGSPTVEFLTNEVVVEPRPWRPQKLRVPWPTYGLENERLRNAPLRLPPPLRRVWTWRAQALLEFPPVIGYKRLYLVTNAGRVVAISAKSGRRAWHYRSKRCSASSPAISRGTVYVTLLNRPPCNASDVRDGEVIAFAAGFGKVRWRKRIGPSESSPLVSKGLVYVGDWHGKVYAFDARTGRTRWTYQTGDRIKGAAALSRGRLFIGSYDGRVYALHARSGRLLWRAASQPRLGGQGNFYSTPTVAFGRVYIGSTDGKVYSFGARSGELRWSQSTGGYVYSSPAIWRTLVLVGSYSGAFYALDAATGDVRWTFRANGAISGSPTVIGRVVYFATLSRRTYALDAATGRELWSFPDGKYSPVVTDGRKIYLVGLARLYGMVPRKGRR